LLLLLLLLKTSNLCHDNDDDDDDDDDDDSLSLLHSTLAGSQKIKGVADQALLNLNFNIHTFSWHSSNKALLVIDVDDDDIFTVC